MAFRPFSYFSLNTFVMISFLKKPASFFFFCLLTLAFVACNKNEGDPDQNSAEEGTAYLEMRVDGETWTADAEINAWGAKHILLTGKKAGSEQAVSANVPYDETTGTYPIETETGSFFHFQKASGSLYQITKGGGHGSITITDRQVNADGHTMLTGTFEGVAIRFGAPEDSIHITEGKFHDVKLD